MNTIITTHSKYITLSLMGVVLCFGMLFVHTAHAAVRNASVTTSSQTSALEQQVADLLERVANLREQINSSRSSRGVYSIGFTKPTNTPRAYGGQPSVCSSPWVKSLSRGSRGEDVTKLQGFLKNRGFFSEEATGYFGYVTENAVQAFQRSEGVVSSGNPWSTGYGRFGNQTRSAVNRLCDEQVATAEAEEEESNECGPTEFCKPENTEAEDEDECGPTEFCKPETATSYGVDDIDSVITYVKPNYTDNGYTQYTITLENGVVHKIKKWPARFNRSSAKAQEQFKKDLRNTGYTDSISAFNKLAEVSKECDPTYCDDFPAPKEDEDETEDEESDECGPTEFCKPEADEEETDECGPTEFCKPEAEEEEEEESNQKPLYAQSSYDSRDASPRSTYSQTDYYSQSSYSTGSSYGTWFDRFRSGSVRGASTTSVIEQLKDIVDKLEKLSAAVYGTQ